MIDKKDIEKLSDRGRERYEIIKAELSARQLGAELLDLALILVTYNPGILKATGRAIVAAADKITARDRAWEKKAHPKFTLAISPAGFRVVTKNRRPNHERT